MEDLISVIVPIYNVEQYLNECLTSIINQTYKNLEILLINDGSTDHSLNICNKYKMLDDRVKVIDKENSGVSDTRNIGVENANGKYILFIDSDDFIDTNMINIMYNTLKENEVDVVRCSCNIVKDNKILSTENNPVDICNKKILKKEFSTILKSIFSINGNKVNCYTPLLLMKKDVVPMFNVNVKYMEDNLFYMSLLEKANSFYFINATLYNYRFNDNSASKNITRVKENIYDMVDVINIIINDIRDKYDSDIIDRIYISQFYVFISKIEILINNKKNVDKELYKVCQEKILPFVKYDLLNKIKKIEYKLLKNKKYKTFEILEKIKKILK